MSDLDDAIAGMRIRAPSERNRSLTRLLAAANANTKLKAYWHAQQVTAQRLGMSDHSWVHLQIVLNSALRIYRLLRRAGVESTIERDYGMKPNDAEVVIAGGCLLHDLGMAIHRVDHESFSLFLAADSEWMFGRCVSSDTRERPCSMSSASATRSTPASSVSGRPPLRWPMIACSTSADTIVRCGSS